MKTWPQLLVLFDLALTFAIACAMAGRLRGVHDPVLKLIDIAAVLAVLYCGGFFAVWGWTP